VNFQTLSFLSANTIYLLIHKNVCLFIVKKERERERKRKRERERERKRKREREKERERKKEKREKEKEKKEGVFVSLSLNFLSLIEPTPEEKNKALKNAIGTLPEENKSGLKLLIRLLKKIADNSDVTKMNSSNLAVVTNRC
jgi:sortase (surface protein transpeptidase)